ncbi:probable serine hydrolase [Daphnia magna]|uniref:Protein ABHD11-like protein n=1 Tax=Daphnia magna TaxID=35525 RepID=A0A164MYE5_9CRUS|nr:probable serine hydrolase [Daphnia magna]KZS05486.1 Protein ABHD11-like protein [Daphnia magna]
MLGRLCRETVQKQFIIHSVLSRFPIFQKRWNHIIKAQDAREIQVPLPHGNMAGKEWGNIEGYPILCLHGFSDNCDSFEPLAPLLSERFRYIALDAPGHGKTSHVPQGSPMNYWELVCYIKRVIDHFNIRKMSILGHSMGGSTGFLVASLYPDIVDRLLTLDVIKPVCVPLQWQTQSKAEAIDLFLSNEKRLKDLKYQKSYTQEQLVNRYVEAMGGTISPEAVRILMKRGSKATGNGFTYSHDPRMMLPLIMRVGIEEQREIIKGLKCHLKIVKAKQGPLYEPIEWLEEFKTIYQRQCASYEYDESVDGTHHFHMHNPERVAPIVNEYFARL